MIDGFLVGLGYRYSCGFCRLCCVQGGCKHSVQVLEETRKFKPLCFPVVDQGVFLSAMLRPVFLWCLRFFLPLGF